MLGRILMMTGLVLGSGMGASGQTKPQNCPLTRDSDNCVRVLACFGEEGLWFHGRAYGWGEGQVVGIRSDGIGCAGTWTSRNVFGVGQADVICEDEDGASVIYSVQDDATGTVIGHGRTLSGAPVKAWSGLYVLDYLKKDGTPDGTLPCGNVQIPMS